MILLLACTAGTGGPGGDDSSTPFTWVAPDDVTNETAPGFHSKDDQETLFDDDDLPRFELEISSSNIQQMRQEGKYDKHEWVDAAFIYDGVRYEPVGVRIKGENSYLPIDEKPSLKVDFNKFVDGMEFMGLKEITLNNMSNDYSMMHERVAYKLFRDADMPAARCGHALLTLNDEDYGLYAHVENVDRTFANRWFEDTTDAIMFEVWDVDFYDGYISQFQLEFGEDDRTTLQGTADALEGTGYNSLVEAGKYMDIPQFIRFYALETVIGQYDSYPFANPGDDAHVLMDPATGLLNWIPHGMDETFYYPDNDPRGVNGIVAKRCVNVNSCLQDYYAAVWEMQELAESTDLGGYARMVQEQIEEHVEADTHKQYTNNQVKNYQNSMISFIETRADKLPNWVGPRPE
jgi:spore coat protein CotH